MYHDPRCLYDPARWGVSSSLLENKSNVSQLSFSNIEVVDINAFVLGLPQNVKLLKIDVEGAEFDLIFRLMEGGGIDRVENILAETHEKAVPSLGEKKFELMTRLAEDEELRNKVSLEWA
jgi:hypothetical protein